MKKQLTILLCAVALVACGSNGKQAKHSFVKPLPASVDLSSLTDATVPATFTADDFNWRGDNLTMTVYSIDLYDAVEVNSLAAGDSIIFRNDTIIVDQIKNDGYITINGGIEEGGMDLAPADGGTYRVQLMNDHPQYKELGKVSLLFAPDFTIIDCGENPTDPSDTIRTEQKIWMDKLEGYKREFCELNTRVTIEGGKITNITRFWIP